MKKKFRVAVALSLVCGALAFTGCTDYEDDINSINGRLDALETGKIASVENQVKALEESLKSMQTVVDGLEKLDLEGLVNDVNGLSDDVDGIKSTVDGLQKSLDQLKDEVAGISFDGYATEEWANSTFATKETVEKLNSSLGEISGKLGKLEESLGALEGKWENEEGVENIKDVLAKISETNKAVSEVKATAEKAASDASKALGEIKELQDALNSYYKKAEVDELLNTKLDADKFDEEFDSALAEAMQNDGVITNAIATAISAATNELNARIDALTERVDDLASRIQSIVFVPEYSDGLATSTVYTMGDKALADIQTVKATFQVTPKQYAVNINAENACINAVSVQTRAASAPVKADNFTIVSANAETGYVEVEAVLPGSSKDYSIALYISDSKAEEGAEGTPDDGSFISSEYVVAKISSINIADRYILYKDDAEIASGAELAYNAVWSAAPAEHKFFEGYSVGIKDSGKTLSIEEAADIFNIPEEALTPVYKSSVEYYKSASAKDPEYKKYFTVNAQDYKDMSVSMALPAEDMQKAVGAAAVVTSNFTVSGTPVISDVISTYTIVKESVNLTLDAKREDWSYDWAVRHSSNDQPNKKAIEYAEVAYIGDVPEGVDVSEIVNIKPSRTIVRLNGVELTSGTRPSLKITKLASEVAKIASVKVNPGYTFSSETENVYEFVNTYVTDAKEFNISFKLTLGRMPADQTIHFEAVEAGLFTENAKEYPVSGLEAAAFESVSSFFSTPEEFSSSLFHAANEVEKTAIRNNEQIASDWTYLTVSPEDKSFIRLSSSDIMSANDRFAFQTSIKTWYGVTYTFNTAAVIISPAYKIVNSPEFMNEKFEAVVKGTVDNDVYVINDSDLSKYIKVEGLDEEAFANNDITIRYTVLTKEDPAAGIINVPTPSASVVEVMPDGKIGSSMVGWLPRNGVNYSARELRVEAALYLGDVRHSSVEMTLTTDKVITEAKSGEILLSRSASEAIPANLWSKLTVKDLAGNSLVDQAAESFSKIYGKSKADVKYGMVISFGNEVKVSINGIEQPNYPTSKYTYNQADGTLIFTGDDAALVNPVKFTITATIQSVLDYNGKDAFVIEIPVVFSQK